MVEERWQGTGTEAENSHYKQQSESPPGTKEAFETSSTSPSDVPPIREYLLKFPNNSMYWGLSTKT